MLDFDSTRFSHAFALTASTALVRETEVLETGLANSRGAEVSDRSPHRVDNGAAPLKVQEFGGEIVSALAHRVDNGAAPLKERDLFFFFEPILNSPRRQRRGPVEGLLFQTCVEKA